MINSMSVNDGMLAAMLDHADCIPRASLPGLPDGWVLPFKQHAEYSLWIVDSAGVFFLSCINEQVRGAMIALLNSVYPPP